MRLSIAAAASLSAIALAGCHSKYVETTIRNGTALPISVVQVEYPSASFGVQALAPGESFHYRFKLLGSGPLKLTYFDSKSQEHHQIGPKLTEGQEGDLTIDFASQDHANFATRLRP